MTFKDWFKKQSLKFRIFVVVSTIAIVVINIILVFMLLNAPKSSGGSIPAEQLICGFFVFVFLIILMGGRK